MNYSGEPQWGYQAPTLHDPRIFTQAVVPPSLINMIAMRLRQTLPLPFEHIDAHQINPERVVVFLVHKGEPLMIEDGALFPSDKLITQLRLLLQ